MSRTVIGQKHEVDSWLYHLEDVNGVLKLQEHIVVGPVALAILTYSKKTRNGNLLQVSGPLFAFPRISMAASWLTYFFPWR
jgi:hypothetical protein